MKTGSQTSFDLHETWNLLRRKFRLICLSMALVLGAALIYLLYVTPLYSATAWLFVDTTQKNLLAPEENYDPARSSDNARIESEVLILKSNTVALAAIQNAQLISHPSYKPQLSLLDRLKTAFGIEVGAASSSGELINHILRKVSDATTIRRMGQTYLISVSATSEDPKHAADLANILSLAYIDLQVNSKVSATLAARDILRDQISSAQDVLAQTEGAFDNYIETNLDRLSQESGDTKLAILRSQLEDSNSYFLAAKIRVGDARQALELRDWESLAATLDDLALDGLASQRVELTEKLGRSSPGTEAEIDLRVKLKALERDLETRTNSAISDLELDKSQLEITARDQRATLRTTVLQGDLSAPTIAQIYKFQQEADIAQRHYTTLLSRSSDLQAQALVQVADTRIVSAALPPSRASFPNKSLIIVLAVIVALMLGIGLALLTEFYVGGVSSATQLANVLPVTVAATVPRVDLGPEQHSVADNIIDAPLSVYSESLRLLRSSIDQSLRYNGKRDCTVVMVTSSIPAEGKSSIALALARTYAAAGKSTLLIDADLRKPAQHGYLCLNPVTSLLDFLSGASAATDGESFFTSDPRSNLGVIMGRDRADIPTDQLLQSETFSNLLKSAKAAMDVIILDTSPLLPVVDARYIAPHVDVVVDCVRYGVTEQRNIRLAFGQLLNSVHPNTPILSLLNLDESKMSGYRYDGY